MKRSRFTVVQIVWVLQVADNETVAEAGKPWQSGTNESFNGKFRVVRGLSDSDYRPIRSRRWNSV